MRESNFNFSCSLAQGDPWDKPSTHVPKNRGPFKSFEEAADDAFLRCPPYLAKNTQWAFPASLTALEAYNGLGYYKRGLPSPYIWSGTDQYQKGKYVSDGRFDPNVVDKQLGAAGLILSLLKVDPALLGPITPSPVPAPVPQSPPIINTPEPDRNQENFFEELWHWLERHLHG
jgi:lysozyme family protein